MIHSMRSGCILRRAAECFCMDEEIINVFSSADQLCAQFYANKTSVKVEKYMFWHPRRQLVRLKASSKHLKCCTVCISHAEVGRVQS